MVDLLLSFSVFWFRDQEHTLQVSALLVSSRVISRSKWDLCSEITRVAINFIAKLQGGEYPDPSGKELKLPVRTTQKVFVQSSSPDPSHHKLNILSSWSLSLLQYRYRLHMFPNEKARILSLFQKLPQKTPRKNYTCWHLKDVIFSYIELSSHMLWMQN